MTWCSPGDKPLSRPILIYSISHKICTILLCFALLWLYSIILISHLPHSSWLLHWYCGNTQIATVPVKKACTIWRNLSISSHNKVQRSAQHMYVHTGIYLGTYRRSFMHHLTSTSYNHCIYERDCDYRNMAIVKFSMEGKLTSNVNGKWHVFSAAMACFLSRNV